MLQNELYDVIILGASEAGIALCEQIKLKSPESKIALVSKHFNFIKHPDKLADTKLILGESVLSSYNHGLIILSLKNRQLVVGKNLVIATGGKAIKVPKEQFKNNKIYYKPSDIPNAAKTKPAVVYGNGTDAVNYAITMSKKFKYVYLCSDVFKLDCDNKLIKKLNNIANIVHLPNCHITACKNDRDGNICEVSLDTYDTIKCTVLVLALGRLPDVSGIDLKMIELDNAGFIKINAGYQTTRVPNIYAIGECTKHNVKKGITIVCNHILGR